MLNWIEQRTGFITMAKDFLTEDVPGGASYWYVFGSATLFAMMVQIVTGIFLTFFYAPSAATAWESTRAIYLNPWTHFLLSVHYWGASAMIALVFLHLLQVLIFGAYKSPRELQWVVGVLLLLVTLVLGLTGYLLPWDMDAYFASQVSLNITGLAPVLGPVLQHIAQGGGSMGTATINRFFGLHVWLMPAVLVLLVGAHLTIFRHNGPAGPVVEDPRTLRKGPFWPDQFFMDGAFSLIVFIIICFLALVAPPYLDQKADPTKFFVPYPAWYFLSLFGLLALVPPEVHLGPLTISLELIATIIVPTIFLLIVLLIPWLDRSRTRGFSSRAGVLWGTTIVVCVIIGLSIFGQAQTMMKQAAAPASPPENIVLAAQAAPVSAGAPGAISAANAGTMQSNTGSSGAAPAANSNGAKVFASNCATCHGAQGAGVPGSFPPLANNPMVTGDPNKVIGIVLSGLHGAISVNGQTYNGQMPPWKGTLSNKDVADVITYIRASLGSNHASAVTEAQVKGYKP
ncbi:MAG: cytochrome b N-terminal domain-containing protein [Candidatus Eremiobacteraeota bacterium]|nr:cytochrome b N-terminal domain-containing protein [Candidatus Eremiobacteraeota bacterium]MBV9698977.1 cytochrome b N-terminal domain-containing protein [Candidatus Eremiobacteraeota bacterium]